MAKPGYYLQMSTEEQTRYRMTAQVALAREGDAWARFGVVPGARVMDLGCGSGAVLVELARMTAPDGFVIGIDQDESAVGTARATIEESGMTNAEAITGQVARTGAEPATYDVVMIRHVLAHNHRDVAREILLHAAGLLRPGGHLWAVDVSADAFCFDPSNDAVRDMARLYRSLHEQAGHDVNIGPRLGSLVSSVGLQLVHRDAYFIVLSPFPSQGGPFGAASEALVSTGLTTPDELRGFIAAMEGLSADPNSVMFVPTFSAVGRRVA